MMQRGINWNTHQQWYRSRGIEACVHDTVGDDYENEYVRDLFRAVQKLNELINVKKHHVYLHCSAGVSRAPTLFIIYLALYIKHK